MENYNSTIQLFVIIMKCLNFATNIAYHRVSELLTLRSVLNEEILDEILFL